MSAKFESMSDGVAKAHGRKFVMCEMTFVDKPEEVKFRDENLMQGNNVQWLKIFFNFELREDEYKTLLEIEGVNSVNKCGKYRIHIFLGEMFKDTVVIDAVERTLNKIIDEHDQLKKNEMKIVFEETGSAVIDRALRNGMRDNNRIVMMGDMHYPSDSMSIDQALARIDPGMTQMNESRNINVLNPVPAPEQASTPDTPVSIMSQEQLWNHYSMGRFDGP